MKSCLVLFLVLLFFGCDKRVYPSFTFKQAIENKMPENIVIFNYGKEHTDSLYRLKTAVQIKANSVWDTTFNIDADLFTPFGPRSRRDSVFLTTDNGRYIRSYLSIAVDPEFNTYCQDKENLLCPENYAETITKNDKRYRFVLE